MTDLSQTVERLREALAKATPGPWEAIGLMAKARHETLFHAGSSNSFRPPRPREVEANVALIVDAVNALPTLLSELTRLQARCAELEEGLRPFAEAWRHAKAVADIQPMIETARGRVEGDYFRRAARLLTPEADNAE